MIFAVFESLHVADNAHIKFIFLQLGLYKAALLQQKLATYAGLY